MDLIREKALGNPNYRDTFLWKYKSTFDTFEDWTLVEPNTLNQWIIYLHGHGSDGAQLFTRKDIVDLRLQLLRAHGFSILAPNLRGNAWMCPAAVHDLHELICSLKSHHDVDRIALFSGSMGGTGNLIYAAIHPEDVDAVIAGCPATDLARYHSWCRSRTSPAVLKNIADAIEQNYGGSPEQVPDVYKEHSACTNASGLNMPLYLSHGNADLIIPVSESRLLAAQLEKVNQSFVYEEIEGGDHDSPLRNDKRSLKWLTNLWGLSDI